MTKKKAIKIENVQPENIVNIEKLINELDGLKKANSSLWENIKSIDSKYTNEQLFVGELKNKIEMLNNEIKLLNQELNKARIVVGAEYLKGVQL